MSRNVNDSDSDSDDGRGNKNYKMKSNLQNHKSNSQHNDNIYDDNDDMISNKINNDNGIFRREQDYANDRNSNSRSNRPRDMVTTSLEGNRRSWDKEKSTSNEEKSSNSNSSWAKTKTQKSESSNLDDDILDKKSSWNNAKPTKNKPPPPKNLNPYKSGQQEVNYNENEQHGTNNDDNNDDDSIDLIKHPISKSLNRGKNDDEDDEYIRNEKQEKNTKEKSGIFAKYASKAESNGIQLPRKSGKYDDDYEEPKHKLKINNNISFVVRAHASGSKTDHVQCVIERKRNTFEGRLYPTYELYLEESKKPLIIAKKMNLNRTSNYHLFDMTRGVAGQKLSKKSGNYLGKLRSKNLNRTEYALVTKNSVQREEMAGIIFDRLGIIDQLKEGSQPRKMTVMVPSLDEDGVPIPNNISENEEGSISDILRSSSDPNHNSKGMFVFETKDPVYENGNYRLNFRGRVRVPSVKNFQLVAEDDIDDIICQFGKIGEDKFNLDYKAPFNAFQAFSLALCQFNL